jgi:hypothetical protein
METPQPSRARALHRAPANRAELSALAELWEPLAEYNGLNPLLDQRIALNNLERVFKENYPVFLEGERHAGEILQLARRIPACDRRVGYTALGILQAWFNHAAKEYPQRLLSVLPTTMRAQAIPLAYIVCLRLAVKQAGVDRVPSLTGDYPKAKVSEAERIVVAGIKFDLHLPTPFESFELWFHVLRSTCLNDDSGPIDTTSDLDTDVKALQIPPQEVYKRALWHVGVTLLDICQSDAERFLVDISFETLAVSVLCAAWLILDDESYLSGDTEPRARFPALTVVCSLGGFDSDEIRATIADVIQFASARSEELS